MTVDTSGLAAAQARVDQIQSLFGSPATAAATPAATGFGTAMTRAQQQTPAAKTTATATAEPTTGRSATAGQGATATGHGPFSRTTTTAKASAARATASAAESPAASTAHRTSTLKASAATDTPSSVGGLKNADAVLATAKKYLGIPYKWGGTNPRTGLDCSGFVQLVLKQHGVTLPRVARDQAREGTRVASIKDALPGDLVAFGSPVHHIGIYVGDGTMIHAPHTGDVVKISKIHKDLTAIRRVLPEASAAAVASFAPATGATAADATTSGTPTTATGTATTRLASLARNAALSSTVDATTWQEAVAGAVTRSLAGSDVDDPQAVVEAALAGLGQGVETTAAQLAATQARTAAAAAADRAASTTTTRTTATTTTLAPDARGTAALDQAPAHLRVLFEKAEQKYGVPATLLAAVAKQESNFKTRAVSHAGAQGLMQLMPGTARGLGVTNSFDPAQAVDGAARLLRSHLRTFTSTELALAAYNAGPGAVRKYDGIPPYGETQNYVRRIMANVKGAA